MTVIQNCFFFYKIAFCWYTSILNYNIILKYWYTSILKYGISLISFDHFIHSIPMLKLTAYTTVKHSSSITQYFYPFWISTLNYLYILTMFYLRENIGNVYFFINWSIQCIYVLRCMLHNNFQESLHFLVPHGYQRLNSVHESWQQQFLPTE